jgi:hypothetical protein
MRNLCAAALLGALLVPGCSKPETAQAVTSPRADAGSGTHKSIPDATPTNASHASDTGATAPTKPAAVRFELCAAGLPETGNWKCDPLILNADAAQPARLIAFARLGDGPNIWQIEHGVWQHAGNTAGFKDPSCGGGLCVTDLNGDGRVDLLVADHCSGMHIFLADESGQWQPVISALVPEDIKASNEAPGFETVAAGDVNGDGLMDFVAGSSDAAGIVVFLGDGTGRNWTPQQNDLPNTGLVNRLRLADINGDGHLDIVASCAAGPRVFLNDGSGKWHSASFGLPSPSIRGLYQSVAVGDVNEDGRVDLVCANWVDGPEVYEQLTDGGWRKSPDIFPQLGGGAFGVALGDLDQDGHLDMVVSGRMHYEEVGFVYGVFVLHGDGHGQWTYEADTHLPATGLAFTWGITLADIDHDGRLDVIAGSGGIVADAPGRTEPVLKPRLLVWTGQPAGT